MLVLVVRGGAGWWRERAAHRMASVCGASQLILAASLLATGQPHDRQSY
jgi:hypothetical protein